MTGQENSDSKNPIYETLSQDVLLNVSGRIRFRSDRARSLFGEKSNHIFSCTGEVFDGIFRIRPRGFAAKIALSAAPPARVQGTA